MFSWEKWSEVDFISEMNSLGVFFFFYKIVGSCQYKYSLMQTFLSCFYHLGWFLDIHHIEKVQINFGEIKKKNV